MGAASEAQAGAFGIREQSSYYQGMSHAGSGTGDVLSSMFWNSAAAAAAPGFNTESHVSLIVPDSTIEATGGAALGLGSASGDIADPALVPSSYANYQVNDRLFFGLAINSPFGLVTKPDNIWAGSPIAVTSDVFSINVNPTVAYKLTPDLTVGVGVQIEYLKVRLTNQGSLLGGADRSAELDDIGFGFTAGASWNVRPGTTIGIGYRSAVDFELEGDYDLGAFSTDNAQADLTLPDMVTIGLRQKITDRFDLLLGYEWTNWSELGEIPVRNTPETLALNYDDGHFFSVGLEYAYTPDTKFRAGVAYEISPISDEERNVLLPDADRWWLSVGATTKLTEKVSVDLAFTHIIADDAPICRAATPGAPPCAEGLPTLIEAEGDATVNIFSASFKYKWGGSEPELEPLK
jgi:long-chain fatty acid transport protein